MFLFEVCPFFFGIQVSTSSSNINFSTMTGSGNTNTTFCSGEGGNIGTAQSSLRFSQLTGSGSTTTTYFNAHGTELGTSKTDINFSALTGDGTTNTTYYGLDRSVYGYARSTVSFSTSRGAGTTNTNYLDTNSNVIGTSTTNDNFSEYNGTGTTTTQYNFKASAESFLKQQIALQKVKREQESYSKKAGEEETKEILFAFQSSQAKISKEFADSKRRHDFTLNFDELKKLAESNNPSAQFLMGLALLTGGHGCIINRMEARRWLEMARASSTAAGYCARMTSNYYSDHTDKAQGMCRTFVGAMNEGYIPAIHFVACGLAKDENPPKERIVEMLTYCANQGYIPSVCVLGFYYLNGFFGVEQNEKRAVELFLIGANAGDAISRNTLGHCYEHGKGVIQNASQARHWYKLAAEQGNENAARSLRELSRCVLL